MGHSTFAVVLMSNAPSKNDSLFIKILYMWRFDRNISIIEIDFKTLVLCFSFNINP
jgi:hypothetical protein